MPASVENLPAITTTLTVSHHDGQDLQRPVSASMANARESPTPRAERSPGGRESLELRELQTREDEEQLGYSSPSASSGEEYRVTTRRRSSTSTTVRRAQPPRKGKDPISRLARFWTRHVTLTVPQRSNRDHFGASFALFSVSDMRSPPPARLHFSILGISWRSTVTINFKTSPYLPLTIFSPREDPPRIHPHLRSNLYARRPNIPTLPSPRTR